MAKTIAINKKIRPSNFPFKEKILLSLSKTLPSHLILKAFALLFQEITFKMLCLTSI
jgi:hypothetical protein